MAERRPRVTNLNPSVPLLFQGFDELPVALAGRIEPMGPPINRRVFSSTDISRDSPTNDHDFSEDTCRCRVGQRSINLRLPHTKSFFHDDHRRSRFEHLIEDDDIVTQEVILFNAASMPFAKYWAHRLEYIMGGGLDWPSSLGYEVEDLGRGFNLPPEEKIRVFRAIEKEMRSNDFISKLYVTTGGKVVGTCWWPRAPRVRAVYDTESEGSGDEDTPAEQREQVEASRKGRPPKGPNH